MTATKSQRTHYIGYENKAILFDHRLFTAAGVQEHRIAYAHRTFKLAEPKIRFAGKRVYSNADLRRMAAYFGVPIGGKDT